MLYKKPHGMTYTDMCIWIDNNAYREDLTDNEKNTIFEYLYHLAKMLAIKGKFFNKSHYYEDFAIYMASELFMRLFNPKQFELDRDGNPRLTKIKSILNYMKGIISHRKIVFEAEHYSQIMSQDEINIDEQPEYTFQSILQDSIDELELVEFDSCLRDACKTIKNFLRKTPYKDNKLLSHNIYISCLLSFLNSITLSHEDMERIKSIKTASVADTYIDNCFEKENKNFTVLYHLPQDMNNYIHVLTKEAKHAVAKDLSIDCHTEITSNTGLQSLTLHELNI